MDLKQMEREVEIAYQARSRRVDVENELRRMAKDCIGQTLQNQLLALAAKLGVAEVYRDSELDKYELIPIDQAVTRLSGAQVAATPAPTPSDFDTLKLAFETVGVEIEANIHPDFVSGDHADNGALNGTIPPYGLILIYATHCEGNPHNADTQKSRRIKVRDNNTFGTFVFGFDGNGVLEEIKVA